MTLRRAVLIALAVAAWGVGPAAAQFGGMPGMPGSPVTPGSPVMPGLPFGAPQQPPPACQELRALRDEVGKNGQAIQAASKKRAGPQELCKLFGVFTAAEAKMLKALETHKATCAVPNDVIAQVKGGHTKSTQIAKQVCDVAAQGGKPPGPSLNDALRASGPSLNDALRPSAPTYTPIGDFPPSCSEIQRLRSQPVPCVE